MRANGGSGGEAPPLIEDWWYERVTERRVSGASDRKTDIAEK